MSTRTALGVHSSRLTLATAWTWVRDRLRHGGGRLKRVHRARRAIGEMMALDDRMLADIGLDRASIGFAAHHGHLPREAAPLGRRSPIAKPTSERRPKRTA